MSKIIVITGGIGSGKSVVSQYLKTLGYQVYDCDSRAKFLNNNHPEIISEIKAEFGDKSYVDGVLNTKYLSGIVFGNSENLLKLNNIVHPRVREDILNWVDNYKNDNLLFVETAILKESNLSDLFNAVILVDAPVDIRIDRVVLRSNLQREEIRKRIAAQDFSGIKVDYRVRNDNKVALIPQINYIIKALTY